MLRYQAFASLRGLSCEVRKRTGDVSFGWLVTPTVAGVAGDVIKAVRHPSWIRIAGLAQVSCDHLGRG